MISVYETTRIVEAVNRAPEELLTHFDGQPWRQIIGMRTLAAHQYGDLEPGRALLSSPARTSERGGPAGAGPPL